MTRQTPSGVSFDDGWNGMIAEARLSRVAKKAFRGLLRFIFLVSLLLFVPAWTFRYWEAWLFLAIVGLGCLGITIYFLKRDLGLVERRMEIGPVAEQEKSQRLIQTLASALTCALLIIPALDHRYGWSDVPVWTVLAADVLLILAFAQSFLVFQENRHAAGTVKVEADQKVSSTGPYGVIRHPFYTAAIMAFLATPLALGSWWGLLLVVPILALIVIRLLHEEHFLAANLPGYADYCREVRYRLFPLIW